MIAMSIEREIRKAKEEGKLIIGSKRTLKLLKNNEIKNIYYASNTPSSIKRDIQYYSKYFNVNAKMLPENSKRLGELCGKPFTVLVIGFKK